MTKHTSVSANFGGRNITFKIARSDLPAFEYYSGRSAYSIFKSIVDGLWLVADLKAVLRFATLPARKLEQYRNAARVQMSQSFGRMGLVSRSDHIDDTFATHPVAPYAGLAMNVLAGGLFGIDADESTFDDGVPVAAE